MSKGFMRVSRDRFEDFEWSHNPTVYYVFFRLLFKANFKDSKWGGIDVKRGQLVTGRKSLSEEFNLSEQQIRTCLAKLSDTGYINQQSTNRYTIITICEYESWICATEFGDSEFNQQSTNNQPTNNQQITTIEIKELKERIKELEKEKEELANASLKKTKSFVPPTVEEVSGYVREQGFHFDAVAFVNFYESKGWFVGKNKMKDWKAACRTWERKRRENVSTPQSREEIGVILRGNNTGKYDNAELWD